jgi:hypothetical protein
VKHTLCSATSSPAVNLHSDIAPFIASSTAAASFASAAASSAAAAPPPPGSWLDLSLRG